MATRTPHEQVRLLALREVYEDAFQQFSREVRVLQSLGRRAASDKEAGQDAKRQVEQARFAYRESREALAQFMLSRDAKPVVTAGSHAQPEMAKIAAEPQGTEKDLDPRSQIERLAHQLWEQAGRPCGRAEEHWYLAERLIHNAS